MATVAAYGQNVPVYLGGSTPISIFENVTIYLLETGIGLSEFYGTFPRSGTMRSGTVYQLPRLALTTTEIGSGFWPTPMNSDWKNMDTANQTSLSSTVKLFPTPAARDYKGARKPETMAKTGRNPETNSLPDSVEFKGESGRLNPTWVEWLMGFPLGHTDLDA